MGRLSLESMLDQGLDFERALAWHLNSNHFPPIPEVFDSAALAINEARVENWDGLIPLPEGVTWRDQDAAPVWACVEGWHLECFLYAEELDTEEVNE